MGRPVEAIETATSHPQEIGSLDLTLDAALSHSPVLRRLQAEEENAAAQTQVARAQALPQVKLRHDQTQGGQQAGGQTYVALEYQTGAGFNILTAMRQAESLRLAAKAEQEAARRDLADAISADWAEWQSLNSQADALAAQVKASEQVYESFARQYAVGRKSWLEVLNAQRELTQARYLLADVQWGALRTQLKLLLASGYITASISSDTIRPERHD